ncbi:MAG: aminomethyl-transferring glycine dehydrogenase subunit GcvPA [Bacillota bacterium]|nr:aminomethyl-transferring glycine dehydrogenase subunit GcvPA [Bacillota bacterium]
MRSYLCLDESARAEMRSVLGIRSEQELFSDIPPDIRHTGAVDLKGPLDELSTKREFSRMGDKNIKIRSCFLGAGAYRHFIPSVVDHLANRSEFYTAYTPYQAEMSQGMLQAIFEYQSLVCELTGMDAANASHYDGATAAAEAMLMCRAATKRDEVLVSSTLHPHYKEVIKTYAGAAGIQLRFIPMKNGLTDIYKLMEMCSPRTAGVIIAQPSFFGCVEDVFACSDITHGQGALLAVVLDPIPLPVLAAPGEYADIAVGEGQSWGLPLSFGGPYLGYMAVKEKYTRNLPGRIAGIAYDAQGRKGYVLTLQAREQHIRREKAQSNICSNQAYCALRAAIHISAMGEPGLSEMARQCYDNAHYLYEKLLPLDGFSPAFDAPFFREFTIKCDRDIGEINKKLLVHGILGGLDLTPYGLPGHWLWCATELNTSKEIEELAAILEVGA